MRCTGYCCAGSFDMINILHDFKDKANLHMYRDVIHFEEELKDVFCFPYGAIVFWGYSPDEEKTFLSFLQKFIKETTSSIEIDEFTFTYGEETHVKHDKIVLHNFSALTKLALSYGIAQSIKMTTFEETIETTVKLTKNLPKELETKGKIKLSRKEISKKIGEIFAKRTYINTHSEMLDTPEFFWDHPELEPFYRRMAQYLDIHKRVEILNRKLKVINELFEILQAELNHQHSSRLEWTIIILIVIEVVLVLVSDILHIV
ncbi:MAG: RMD1 family protein [Rhabdochlamydiaceae bacterium]